MFEKIPIWKCGLCGLTEASAFTVCPECRARNSSEIESSGEGAIVASTIIRRPSASSAFDGPINLCVVRLEEGLLVPGHGTPTDAVFKSGTQVRFLEYLHDVPIFEIAT